MLQKETLHQIPTKSSFFILYSKQTKRLKITEVWPEYGTLSWLFDHVVLFVLRQNFGKAEISDLHPQLTLHKDISCCQIPVDIPLTWQVLHTLWRQ